MKAKLFSLNCLTNMHVGTGDYSVSIIDNEVSRDVVDNTPNINGSGVKGALREYFESHTAGNKNTEIFGGVRIKNRPENKSDDIEKEKNSAVQGKLKFLSANLLARPVRANNGGQPYYLVTTKTLVERFNQLCQALGIANSINLADNSEVKINIEGQPINKPLEALLINIFENDEKDEYKAYIIDEQIFNDLDLPVVARNQVKREASDEREATRGNLWFEEIVPYNSWFYFFVLANDGDENLLDDFASKINGEVVQFGGNASVGYGYTVLEDKTEQKGAN